MPESYSWVLVEVPLSGTPPDPGSYVASTPAYGKDPRKNQFERGIKFANVPGGRAEFVVHGGPRIYHVNSVQNIMQDPCDRLSPGGTYSGAVKFRFRSYRNFNVPAGVSKVESRSSDRFTNPVFPFTAQYGSDHVFTIFNTGSVNTKANMSAERWGHVASLLPGKQVIIAGGRDRSGSLDSAEIYTSAAGTNSWQSTAAMPFKKSHAAGITLSGSNDFVIFGGSASGTQVDVIGGTRGCRYSYASGTWTALPSSSVSRMFFEVVQIADGRVFLPGGTGPNSVTGSEFFYPDTNTFSGAAAFPLPPYNRRLFTTTLLEDDSVLVCGGYDPTTGVQSDNAFRYYPSVLSWSIEPSMSCPRATHQAVYVDGRVVVMGGTDSLITTETVSLSAVDVYDPATRTWTVGARMPTPRSLGNATGYTMGDGSGRIVMMGGVTGSDATGGVHTPPNGVDTYIVEEDRWLQSTPLTSGAYYATAVGLNTSVANGQLEVLFVGGLLTGSGAGTTSSGSQLFVSSG